MHNTESQYMCVAVRWGVWSACLMLSGLGDSWCNLALTSRGPGRLEFSPPRGSPRPSCQHIRRLATSAGWYLVSSRQLAQQDPPRRAPARVVKVVALAVNPPVRLGGVTVWVRVLT